jgi:hypothetical protein
MVIYRSPSRHRSVKPTALHHRIPATMLITVYMVLAALLISSEFASSMSTSQEVLRPEHAIPEANITTYRRCWDFIREACRADYEDCENAMCSSLCLCNYPGLSNCCNGNKLRADQVRECLIRYVTNPDDDDGGATLLVTSSASSSSSRRTSSRATSSSISAANFRFVPPPASAESTRPNGETRLTAIGSGKLALAGILINSALWIYLF